MKTNRISLYCILALFWLFSAVNAPAENLWPVPDHVWVLGIDSHHPIGVAWWNPTGAGMHSSIEMVFCFGAQHGFAMKLPVAVLGLLMLGVLVGLFVASLRPQLQARMFY